MRCDAASRKQQTGSNNKTVLSPLETYVGPNASEDDVQAFMVQFWDNVAPVDRCGQCHDASHAAPFARTDDINAAYNATLPCVEMVTHLRANHIPAALSFSAGTHLCNQLIYTLAHTAEQRGIALQSGFVHIPQSPENIAEKSGLEEYGASMDIATSTRAVRLCVELLAAKLAA